MSIKLWDKNILAENELIETLNYQNRTEENQGRYINVLSKSGIKLILKYDNPKIVEIDN